MLYENLRPVDPRKGSVDQLRTNNEKQTTTFAPGRLFLIIFTRIFNSKPPTILLYAGKNQKRGLLFLDQELYSGPEGPEDGKRSKCHNSIWPAFFSSEEPTTCALAFFKLNKQEDITFLFSLLIKTHPFIQFWQVIQFKSVKFHDLYRLILITTTFANTIFFS